MMAECRKSRWGIFKTYLGKQVSPESDVTLRLYKRLKRSSMYLPFAVSLYPFQEP